MSLQRIKLQLLSWRDTTSNPIIRLARASFFPPVLKLSPTYSRARTHARTHAQTYKDKVPNAGSRRLSSWDCDEISIQKQWRAKW